jgi:hypothetical protein
MVLVLLFMAVPSVCAGAGVCSDTAAVGGAAELPRTV